MLPTSEAAVRSALGASGATKIKVEGTDIRSVIKNILGEEMAKLKKVRLTWNQGHLPEPPDPSMRVGLLCKWKPYFGPIGNGRYYVQNAMVLMSNGEPVEDMGTISEEKKTERLVDGKGNFLREVSYASDRKMVEDALANYLQIAIRLDPNLCRYCARFSTESREEYMKHLKKKHPTEFDTVMDSAEDGDEAPSFSPTSTIPKKTRAQ